MYFVALKRHDSSYVVSEKSQRHEYHWKMSTDVPKRKCCRWFFVVNAAAAASDVVFVVVAVYLLVFFLFNTLISLWLLSIQIFNVFIANRLFSFMTCFIFCYFIYLFIYFCKKKPFHFLYWFVGSAVFFQSFLLAVLLWRWFCYLVNFWFLVFYFIFVSSAAILIRRL